MGSFVINEGNVGTVVAPGPGTMTGLKMNKDGVGRPVLSDASPGAWPLLGGQQLIALHRRRRRPVAVESRMLASRRPRCQTLGDVVNAVTRRLRRALTGYLDRGETRAAIETGGLLCERSSRDRRRRWRAQYSDRHSAHQTDDAKARRRRHETIDRPGDDKRPRLRRPMSSR
jgi:hypothetical protein